MKVIIKAASRRTARNDRLGRVIPQQSRSTGHFHLQYYNVRHYAPLQVNASQLNSYFLLNTSQFLLHSLPSLFSTIMDYFSSSHPRMLITQRIISVVIFLFLFSVFFRVLIDSRLYICPLLLRLEPYAQGVINICMHKYLIFIA